jgi:hypothetical protein
MTERMTLKAFAALHGVSRQTASKWRNRGFVISGPDGLVDVAASNALLADRPQVYRGGVKGGNPAKGGVKDMKIAESTRLKETYLAMLAQLRYERAAAKLCEIDAVLPVIKADYAVTRARCMRIAADAAAAIAARPVWPNAEEAKNIIDGTVIAALDELTSDEAFEGTKPH